MSTEYPCNSQVIKRGLARQTLNLAQGLSKENYLDLMDKNLIITNDYQFWDYEAFFKIGAYISCMIFSGSIRLDQGQKYLKSQSWLSYLDAIEQLKKEPFFNEDIRFFRTTIYGSFESIVKDYNPHALMMETSRTIPTSPLKGDLIVYQWTSYMGELKGSHLKFSELNSELPDLDLTSSDIIIYDYLNREPRGPTTGYIKYRHLLSQLDIYPSYVAVLGDGTGGTSRAVLDTFEDCLVNTYSKKVFSSIDPFFSEPSIPFEHLLISDHQNSRLNNLNHPFEAPGDIFDSNLRVHIKRFFSPASQQQSKLIIIDIEGLLLASSNAYISKILELISFVEPQSLIFKTYLDVSFNLIEVLNALSAAYSPLLIFHSIYSSCKNKEIFIFGQCRQGIVPPIPHSDNVSDKSATQYREMIQKLVVKPNIHISEFKKGFKWRFENYGREEHYKRLIRVVNIPLSYIMQGKSYLLIKDSLTRSLLLPDTIQRRKEFTKIAEILLINEYLYAASVGSTFIPIYFANTLRNFRVSIFSEEPFIRRGEYSNIFNYTFDFFRSSYRKKLIIRLLSYWWHMWNEEDMIQRVSLVRISNTFVGYRNLGLERHSVTIKRLLPLE